MNSVAAANLITAQNASGDALTNIKEVDLRSGDLIEFDVTAIGGGSRSRCEYTSVGQ